MVMGDADLSKNGALFYVKYSEKSPTAASTAASFTAGFGMVKVGVRPVNVPPPAPTPVPLRYFRI
jgi:hypothetical protein